MSSNCGTKDVRSVGEFAVVMGGERLEIVGDACTYEERGNDEKCCHGE